MRLFALPAPMMPFNLGSSAYQIRASTIDRENPASVRGSFLPAIRARQLILPRRACRLPARTYGAGPWSMSRCPMPGGSDARLPDARCPMPACPPARLPACPMPGAWSGFRAPWLKGPGARFRVRNGGFPGFSRDSGPRGGVAAAPALFRTNNHRKNDMA